MTAYFQMHAEVFDLVKKVETILVESPRFHPYLTSDLMDELEQIGPQSTQKLVEAGKAEAAYQVPEIA